MFQRYLARVSQQPAPRVLTFHIAHVIVIGVCSVARRDVLCALSDSSSQIHRVQAGVLRTNCIDCLDRTNIAQFSLAKLVLRHQLVEVGMQLSDDDYDQVWPILLSMFSRHGDDMAHQYVLGAAFLLPSKRLNPHVF